MSLCMHQNEQLEKLYRNHWDDISNALENQNKKYAMPFLIKVPEAINNPTAYKIMIFGQETLGWYDHRTLEEWIAIGMPEYEKFYLERNFYEGYSKSSFWKKFRYFERELSNAVLDQGKSPVFIWNNISKIGKSKNLGSGIFDAIRKIERENFSVISQELQIIKPDLCIFMTGPNRDHDIRFHFPEIKISQFGNGYPIREMAQLELCGFNGIRLYHPSYYGKFTKKYQDDAMQSLKEMM